MIFYIWWRFVEYIPCNLTFEKVKWDYRSHMKNWLWGYAQFNNGDWPIRIADTSVPCYNVKHRSLKLKTHSTCVCVRVCVYARKAFNREFKIHVLEITCTAKSISTRRRFTFGILFWQVLRDEGRPPPYLVVYAWKQGQFHCKENMVEGVTVCYFMIYHNSI